VLEGFPCRITYIQQSPTGKCGHIKHWVYGVGIFDQKQRSELFGPNTKAIVPMVVESNIFEEDEPSPKGDGLPFVSWMNEEHIPHLEGHFVLTTTIDGVSEEDYDLPLPAPLGGYDVSSDVRVPWRAITTAVWTIPKRQRKGDYASGYDGPCRFFLQERDDFIRRERENQQRRRAFLETMEGRDSPSAILRRVVEIEGVLENIFQFACYPQKYRPDPESYFPE